MRTIIFALSLAVLVGCAGSPVKSPFPDLPVDLMVAPDKLVTLLPNEKADLLKLDDSSPSSIVLSQLGKTLTTNYKTCNVYREQIFGLQNWLLEQKKLNP